jgi:hypothetical protein
VGPSIPWALVYVVLAGVAAVVIFGSIRTRDAALAVAVSVLIGAALLLPIGLIVLVLGFVLVGLGYQAAAIALAVDSTPAALAVMAGLGGAAGGVVGLFAGLRRLRRTASGCTLAVALLAALLVGLATFSPVVTFGPYRPNQPLLQDLSVPVPYLAFGATVHAPGPTRRGESFGAAPTAAGPTATPTPAPVRRSVEEVLMLWDVDRVGGASSESGDESPARTETAVTLDAAIDVTGRPHVAYIAGQSAAQGGEMLLRYATHDPSTESGAWVVETVTREDALSAVALALDGEGLPYIAYTAGDGLYIAEQAGDAWDITTVGGLALQGKPAIAVAPDTGTPFVAYAGSDGALNLAYPVEGAGWQVAVIDSGGEFACPALALDGDGLPHAAYVDLGEEALKYAYLAAPLAAESTLEETATPTLVGDPTQTPEPSAWLIETVTPRGRQVGCDVALALGRQAWYVLFYETATQEIYEAAYSQYAGRWYLNAIAEARSLEDEGGSAPLSLALDTQGRVHMAFNAPGSLRFVRQTYADTLQNAVVDGASTAHRVLLDQAFGAHIAYLRYGEVLYASLLQAPDDRPTPTFAKPTIGAPERTPTTSPTPFCGDGLCQEGDVAVCPADCVGEGWTCGNDLCEEPGEDAEICPADCAVFSGDVMP